MYQFLQRTHLLLWGTADEGQGVDGCREGDGVGKEGKVTEQELAIMFYHFIN